MPGYPPWVMPPAVGQPGVPNPYGYYGQQYGQQGGGSPQGNASQPGGGGPPPPQYGGAPPPPPPGGGGLGGNGGQMGGPPLPPPAPQAIMGAWSEHLTPEGLRYYYNTQTGTSSWEVPHELQPGLQPKPQHHRQPHHGGHHGQGVPPLPPLPQGGGGAAAGQGGGLDKAMEALSIGANGGGYQQSGSPLSGGGAYLPHSGNGLGTIGGMTSLGLSGMPPNGGDGNGNGDHAGIGGEQQQQWWPGQEQAVVNVQ